MDPPSYLHNTTRHLFCLRHDLSSSYEIQHHVTSSTTHNIASLLPTTQKTTYLVLTVHNTGSLLATTDNTTSDLPSEVELDKLPG